MRKRYHAFWSERGDLLLAKTIGGIDSGPMLMPVFDRHVMPLRCVFCGTNTERSGRHLCTGCAADLPRRASPPPPLTSPLAYELAPLQYAFPVDAGIKALKFGRKLWYAPAFGELLAEASRALPNDIDAILPVPLHWRRKWYRGFNQAVEIARPVSQQLGLPLVRNVRRRRATQFQSGLTARQREENLRAAFRVHGALPFHHVLLVDDVITTGATLRQLARVVLRAGADRVSALAIARA